MRIQCSNCGYTKLFKATDNQVTTRLREGWNSFGGVLYCPECVRTWDERNGKDRPVWGIDHTKKLIDRIRLENKRKPKEANR